MGRKTTVITLTILFLTLLTPFTPTVHAVQPETQVFSVDKETTVAVPAYMEGGTTMVPLYAVSRLTNTSLNITQDGNQFTLRDHANRYTFVLGKSYVWINGVPKKLNATPDRVGDRVFVPLRSLVTYLGGEIHWNSKTGDIQIFSPRYVNFREYDQISLYKTIPSTDKKAKLVFSAHLPNALDDVYFLNVDGTGLQNLTHTPWHQEQVIGQTSRGLLYVAVTYQHDTAVYQLDMRSGEKKRLFFLPEAGQPLFSDDGESMALANNKIILYSRQGRFLKMLASSSAVNSTTYENPVWGAGRLYFDEKKADTRGNIQVTEKSVSLSGKIESDKIRRLRDLGGSPNGQYAVYLDTEEQSKTYALFLMDLSKGSVAKLLDGFPGKGNVRWLDNNQCLITTSQAIYRLDVQKNKVSKIFSGSAKNLLINSWPPLRVLF